MKPRRASHQGPVQQEINKLILLGLKDRVEMTLLKGSGTLNS